MNRLQALLFFLALALCSTPFNPMIAESGTIYYWIDENGVHHFTNRGKPEGVKNVKTIPEFVSTPAEQDLNTPAEAPTPQAPPAPSAEEPTEMTGEERRLRAEQAQLEDTIEEERKRLQAEIDKIDNLAIGVSFTQGMKDNRRRPFQEQLNLLKENPEKYFRMKKEGAFENPQ